MQIFLHVGEKCQIGPVGKWFKISYRTVALEWVSTYKIQNETTDLCPSLSL